MAINVMQRYEMKYLLDRSQTDYILQKLEGHMQADEYGLTSIASLYYDTPDARLIRNSLDKPAFKEKLRLRSYGLAADTSPVYLELKRKCEDIVYKRRVPSTIPEIGNFFAGADLTGGDEQIRRELTYFRDFYKTLVPACLIIYDRTAYFEPDGDLRLTIDYRPRYRTEDLTLTKSMEGRPLLQKGWSILEIKVQGAMPLWLSSALSTGGIFKNSFSKYKEAYRLELLKENEKGTLITAPAFLRAA